ncbi:MAG: hypothetical protein AB7E52_00780, partial [Bdellovibrionales bacterium]
LYNGRQDNQKALNDWLKGSMGILATCQSCALGDVDYANALLSSHVTADMARGLAKAAYSFWYQPALSYIEKNPGLFEMKDGVPTSWGINKALNEMVDGKQNAGEAVVLNKLSHRLNLARLAFDTASGFAVGYREFHKNVFVHVAQEIVGDPKLCQLAKEWPEAIGPDYEFLPGVLVSGKKGPILSDAYLKEIKKFDLVGIAEKVSRYYIEAAIKERSDLFSDFGQVKANLFAPNAKSGTFGYDKKQSVYSYGADTCYTFASFLNLVTDVTHETEHFVQNHLGTKKCRLSPSDPLAYAAKLFEDDIRIQDGKDSDQGVSLYAPGLSSFIAFMRAKTARPMEYFAHRTDALGRALGQHLKAPVYLWSHPKHDYLVHACRHALGG